MEIIFKWVIQQLITKPKEGELLDVVVAVKWRRQAYTIVNDIEYVADVFNVMECETPSSTDFTAYPDLTYDQVCGWLDNGVNVVLYDNQLIEQLNLLINPPVIILPLPWDKEPEIQELDPLLENIVV